MRFVDSKLRRSVIGIDVGARHLRAVQLDAVEQRIAAATVLSRANPGAALSAADVKPLAGVLNRAGFVGNKISLAVPLEKQFGGVLDLPRSERGNYRQIAHMELAAVNRCPPAAFETQCWELPNEPVESMARVMAVACRHDDATACLNLFESAGFEVETLDSRAVALARAAGPIANKSKGILAVLELNWQSTLLALVDRGTLIYERRLADVDLQNVYDGLMQRLQLDAELADYLLLEAGLDALAGDAPIPRQARAILSVYADALSSELSASLAYAMQNLAEGKIESLVLCGDGAGMPGMESRLAEAARTPVRKVAPADFYPANAGVSDTIGSPAMTAALGLAL